MRRFVVNDENKKVTGSFSKGRQGLRYPFYRFGSKGSNYNRDKFEDQYREYLDSFSFTEEHKRKLEIKIRAYFGNMVEREKKDTKKLAQRISELQNQQNTLIEKNLKGVISDDLLKRQLQVIEEELTTAKINLADDEQITFDIDEAMGIISPFLDRPSEAWSKAKIDKKIKLQWFQFPSGVLFNGKIFGNTKIASIYKVKSASFDADSTVVDFDTVFLNRLATELNYLVWVLKGDYEKA